MKLEYKILWLDDKMNDILSDEYDKELKKHLEDKYFIAVIDTTKNENDFFAKLSNDDYDLILTDYNLNQGERNGKEIVEEIRKQNIFTEIMFYSAQGSVIDTDKLDRISFLDTSKTGGDHYQEVIDKIKTLIDLTVRKFENIISMRGMIMHETSSLDVMINSIVTNYINNKEEKDKEMLLSSIFDEIEKNAREKYEKIRERKVKKILKDNVLFNASQKINALGKILQNENLEDFSESYSEEIIWHRNQFAHTEIHIDDNGKKYFKIKDNDELIFDENLCRTIRRNISKHKRSIEELAKKL
ncbi:response regulator [Capnocytophaga cynodegmi]|uniref:response regulator n=1 Tax=Capnocytophaga cynodegmi TaxID=28189 RepID=UPI0037CDA277